MDITTVTDDTADQTEVTVSRMPVLFVRRGRGRTGGSTLCDYLIQRARRNDRRAKALDGDLRSRTLIDLYPAQHGGDAIDVDAASSPANESAGVVRAWLHGELNAMAEDRVSRLLDLGGGDRVIQDFVQDLSLVEFGARFNIRLVQAFFLGPDEEDFRHVVSTIDHAQFDPRSTIFYLNDGVIRTGQTSYQVFTPLTRQQKFMDLIDAGVRTIRIPRVICLDDMRGLGLTINDVLANRSGSSGRRAPPTMQIMIEDWCRRLETAHIDAGAADLLP